MKDIFEQAVKCEGAIQSLPSHRIALFLQPPSPPSSYMFAEEGPPLRTFAFFEK